MRALADLPADISTDDGDWSDYLRTHPGMGERIREAENAASAQQAEQ